jgi:hypothetical protein
MKLFFTILFFPFYSFANTYYVSQNGNNDSSGLFTNKAWQTLSKVQSTVASGDSVLFEKGSKFSGTLSLSNKNNIYFGVYGSGVDPLFWGNGNTIGSLITLGNCSSITFYGWTISDTTISPTDRTIQANIQTVFQFENGSTNNVIRRCTMDRIGYGAYFTTFSNGNTMDSSDIGNLRMIVNTIGGDNDFGGVPVQFSSRNNVVTNNYFHDCYAVSFDYGYDGGGVEFYEEGDTVMNNVIMYNTFYDGNGTFEFGSSSDSTANNPQINNVIAYNKVINSSSLFFINNRGKYITYVRNLQLYNNIIVQDTVSRTGGTRMLSMALPDTGVGIAVMKNNIFYVTNGASIARADRFDGTQLVHTNNVYTLRGGGDLNFTLGATERLLDQSSWVDTTNANPLFWDYNLRVGTYAINNGINVGLTRDFNNNVVGIIPDIGVLEFITTQPTNKIFTNLKFKSIP